MGQHAPREVRGQTEEILETALTAAPDLRVLGTCRWPLGLADHEMELGVPPMAEDEGRDVFVSHLDSAAHRFEVKETWDQPDSAIRQLVRMSGRHPQSLRLLARQMGRPGMTLDRLRDEAREDLLKVLADPLASDDEENRLKKVEVSYQLSYRHLSEEGKRLFERLCRLPGGVWCGESAEKLMDWHDLLGSKWREIMEKELDYFALVHFEPEGSNGGAGTFEMLPPMLEFARRKYDAADHGEWEKTWIEFWRQRVGAWSRWISGRLSEGVDLSENQRKAAGTAQQQVATQLFARTQPNWLAIFDHAANTDGPLTRWFLQRLVSFCQLSGQRILLRNLAQRPMNVLRTSGPEKDLAACLLTLGNAWRDLGEWEAARESYIEALEICRRFGKIHPAASEPNVATTLNNLGLVLNDLGDREAARDHCAEALGIQRRLAQAHPGDFEPDIAMTLSNLGLVLNDLGEWESAWNRYAEALEIYRCLAKDRPTTFEPNVATTLNNLGTVQRDLGDQEVALDCFNEALEIQRRLVEAHPAAFRSDVAATLNNLGTVQHDLGDREAAGDRYAEALGIYRRLAKAHPAAFESDVAMTLGNLGVVQRELGCPEAARESYTEVLEIQRRLAKVRPAVFEPAVATTLNNLGNVRKELGDRGAARESYTEALAIRRRLAKVYPAAFEQDVATTLSNLGNVQRDLGDRESARESYTEALEIQRRLAKVHPAAFEQYVAATLNNLGNVQRDLGDRESARESFTEALEIYAPLYEKWPRAFGQNLGIVLRNYTTVTEEDEGDRWWQFWRRLQEGAAETSEE